MWDFPRIPFEPKLKLISALFGQLAVYNEKLIYDVLFKYDNFLIKNGFKDTPEKFLANVISQMASYGLPCDIIIIGRRRMGKSMLSLNLTEDGYLSREKPFDYKNFIDNYVLYSNKQRPPLQYDQYIIKDEGYLTSDRRRSMVRAQVESTADSNFNASFRAVSIENMQQYTDLDKRRIDVATILIMIKKQNDAKVFAAMNPLPITKQSFGFGVFDSDPSLLKDVDIANKILDSRAEYVFDIDWYNKEDSAMFKYYKGVKEEWQNKRHDRKSYDNSSGTPTKKDKVLELLEENKKLPLKKRKTTYQIAEEAGVVDSFVSMVKSGRR